jgi:predicted metal-dependent enzyme (double-stranded beta helix superfamily)
MSMTVLAPLPLISFVGELERLLAVHHPLPAAPPQDFLILAAQSLSKLVRTDSWLPEAYARPHPDHYRQYLLYRDPDARFSVVSFVWGPGQRTPVHDHQVWGLVGVLRGAEYSQSYRPDPAGPERPLAADGPDKRLAAGVVEILSPADGDIHRVRNAYDDRVSVSIHVYGGDIGAVRRWTFPPGAPPADRKPFVSGYGNDEANPPFSRFDRLETIR